MKYRGKTYEDNIKRLKALRAEMKIRGRKSEVGIQYKKLMEKICKKFSISEKTVYRDMNKRVPGLRKTRADSGKYKSRITKNEVKIAEEIMRAGKTKKEAASKAKVSQKKMKRISEKIQKAEAGARKSDESMFGKEAKKFFEKFFEFDLIAPEKGVRIRSSSSAGRVDFIVQKEDLKDIILILANAYNRQCFADEKKLKVSRDELRNMMMHQLVEELMMLARDAQDYKMIESITRMLDRLNEDEKLPGDFDTIIKICKELKPDISASDVIELIKKVARN